MTNMDYSKASKGILRENAFDANYLGKCEAAMCLGNGYMGLRSAAEERYLGERRDLFVAGTFNKFDQNEVTELPNAADVLAMDIYIDGEIFNLLQGSIKSYERELHLHTGELVRNIVWISKKGTEIRFKSRRIVSMEDLHIIAQKIEITADKSSHLRVVTGIDGRMTNNGSQHFSEGDKRLFEKKYMQYTQTTTESKIDFVFTTGVKFGENGCEKTVKSQIVMDRRQINMGYDCELEKDTTLFIEKITDVRTTRDKEYEGIRFEDIKKESLESCKKSLDKGFERLLADSSSAWKQKVWDKTPISISSKEPCDQLAILFAQYHLYVMVPAHDNRMNIGAKGLSGEGYKGHTFWDTDIFALPYFTFTDPNTAKKLEEYRYLTLPGAHAKAKENGFKGAMFPWESAWLNDGEVTPVWGAADIITGLPTKIWSGFIEQHITSDVAFGIWQYYMVTDDQDFMDRCGYELLMDTAKFWVSRLEFSEKDNLYHINNVVGPDEYKEHANDNAFTNYMAFWNIGKAMEYYLLLKEEKVEIFERLDKKLDLTETYKEWVDKRPKIYLPKPREKDQVLPQDADYLSLKEIDLAPYKNREQVGTLFLEYNLEQVNKMQVSKQADVMVLFFLMEDLFSDEVKKASWDYYEPKTLHDSSLSLSTHCILASDMENSELAYSLFTRARNIDAGPNMKSSNDGIHAASIAGIWQSTVFGFGGVRMLNGKLRINPRLPKEWSVLSFVINWHGERLSIKVTDKDMQIINETGMKEVTFEHKHQVYQFEKEITINL